MSELDEADQFMSSRKDPVGRAEWHEAGRPGAHFIEWPLFIEGHSTGGRLRVEVASDGEPERFKILLLKPKCLSRLDYDKEDRHKNPLKTPKGVNKGVIKGPHFHSWNDNRRFADRGSIPKQLKIARELDPKLDSVDKCFVWFCRENDIDLPEGGLPPLVAQRKLL